VCHLVRLLSWGEWANGLCLLRRLWGWGSDASDGDVGNRKSAGNGAVIRDDENENGIEIARHFELLYAASVPSPLLSLSPH
jgi:hypothetical protein